MEPGTKDGRTRHRRPWRDNLEAMVMAVVMALLLKHFVVEAYKIPSGSMQPTLIGDETSGIEDRILVDKLSYLLREPRRWEVAVFRYPLERSKSFVKRIAGIGPEELLIRDGDVWRRQEGQPWRIARRPRSVQDEMWKRIDEEDPDVSPWIPQGLLRSSSWRAEGHAIQARGSGTVAFHGGGESILDEYLDGYPASLRERLDTARRESRRNPVGDLRVAGAVRALAGLEVLTIVLQEGPRHYRFELPGPAAAPEARLRIDPGPFAVGPEPGLTGGIERLLPDDWRLEAGRTTRFAAWNLDDRLELEIDGRIVARVDIQSSTGQSSAVHLSLTGEGADLDQLSVWRDVYYIDRSTEPVSIPAGHYFMLGDNTQDSSDSREWTFVVLETEDEDGTPHTVRGNWREGENPIAAAYGAENGPLTRLIDEWGETHWFGRGASRRLAPEYAPFVPRDMIQGRALAVFWPLNPFQDVWRLKWVR